MQHPSRLRHSQPRPASLSSFNTVVVAPFTNANGMTQSQDFIHFFSDYLSVQLTKDKVAAQVVDQGTTVPDAVAANSLVIEGKFLSHEDAGLIKPGKLIVEISIYRLSDHALVKTWTPATHFPLQRRPQRQGLRLLHGRGCREYDLGCAQKRGLVEHSPRSPRLQSRGSHRSAHSIIERRTRAVIQSHSRDSERGTRAAIQRRRSGQP